MAGDVAAVTGRNSTCAGRRLVAGASAAALILAMSAASADARTEYLVQMLESGGSYRVRVQAATTLGKIRSHDAVPALARALSDENELVVISAATALSQIGETSVIPQVEAALERGPSEAARSQLRVALRILKALTPEGDTASADASEPRFLIRVDAMGNSSGVNRRDATDLLRDIVLQRLRKEPGVVLQEPGAKAAAVRKRLGREKLKGYILSGSILRMDHEGDRLVVKISLNVFSNPDYNLLMMPSAEGAIPVIAGPLTRETEHAAQERGLRMVADSLLGSIFKTLRSDAL